MLYPIVVGRVISRFRYQRGWTQDSLAANMQILGCDASGAVIANIETGRTQPTYKQLIVFSEVFRVPVTEFFPEQPGTLGCQPSSTSFAQRLTRQPQPTR